MIVYYRNTFHQKLASVEHFISILFEISFKVTQFADQDQLTDSIFFLCVLISINLLPAIRFCQRIGHFYAQARGSRHQGEYILVVVVVKGRL